ncbi:RloB family protein [Okeania sp. KiyG1]|uniref:RloB family protein n=1 Tax=Okeania sp. KiyG1 TaxID=2720165 RepID=UPI0019AF7354|nr:RloB family protein [Okeania sp. KiyG1]GGA08608.1 hypothetical protein CYANOKiyG1_21370 [Okeania sp. KiyG1]
MAKQKASKKNYKNSRKSKYSHYSRNETVAIREVIERFLIVCEGEETEPNYLRSFRVPKDVIDVRGLGEEPSKLVKEPIKIRDKEDNNDLVWCVFDN